MCLGAGRKKKEDKIDKLVGIELLKKVGSKVQKDEVIAYIHSDNYDNLEIVKKELLQTVKIDRKWQKNKKQLLKL